MKGWSVKWLKESIAYTEVKIRKAFSCRRTPATIFQRKKAGTLLTRLGRNLNETPFIAEWFTKKGIHVWSVYEGEIIDAVDAERMLDYIRFWQTDEAQKL